MRATVFGNQKSNFTGTVDFSGTRAEIRRFAEENKCRRILYTDGLAEIYVPNKGWQKDRCILEKDSK